MKLSWFSLTSALCLTLSMYSLAVFSKTLTISSAQQTDVSLTLLANGKTLIQETRTIAGVDKNDSIILSDIATDQQNSAIEITGAGEIGPISYNNHPLTPQAEFKYLSHNSNQNIQISYLSNSVNFDTQYVLTLINNQLSLQAFTTIFNQSNTTFNNASVAIMHDRLSQSPANKNRPLNTNNALLMLNNAKQTNAKSFIATYPDKLTLPPKYTSKIAFLDLKQLNATISYHYNTRIRAGINNNQPTRAATVNVLINNGAKGDLKYLNKGIASLYQQRSTGVRQLLSEGPLLFSQTANDLALALGSSKDIDIEQRQISSQKTFNGEIVSLQFKITNRSDNTKNVRLKSSFDSNYKIISSSLPAQQYTQQAIWQIPVTANNINVFTISSRLFNDQ
ncbi:hypothetical protein WN093_06135 [Gammaproteobacteria bacterium AS21]